MHIALLSPGWPLEKYQNGIVTYVHWMKKALEAKGHQVSVLSGGAAESDPDSHVYKIPPLRRRPSIRKLFRRSLSLSEYIFEQSQAIANTLLEIHRTSPIDVVEMEESFGWFAEVRRITGIPVVAKLHGPAFLSLVGEELNSEFAREKINREGAALRVADAISSPSMDTLSHTMAKYDLQPRLAEHIANPVPPAEEGMRWQLEACDRSVILFVGRFDLRKGADVVLKAFAQLAPRRAGLRLIFVGPDNGIRDEQARSCTMSEFCALHLEPEVVQRVDYRGRLSNREIMKLRISAMVTVVASRWESQGYTALEAMSQGCPVVSSDAGALPEAVIHQETGLLARSGSHTDFAHQIAVLLDNPLLAQRLAQNAERFVGRKHAPDYLAAKSLDLYNRLLPSDSSAIPSAIA